jgi:molybdate transport system substrate-binding protein
VDEIAAAFEKETGIKVNLTYGGSAQLNSQILLARQGDVYLPGDVAELAPLREKNLIALEKAVVCHVPALAVPKGNPASVLTLADLARPGVRVALGEPTANPIGKLADKVLAEHHLLEAVTKNLVVRTPTVNELVVYLSTRQADAAIIWEENHRDFANQVDLIRLPELDKYVKTVPVAVLACAKEPEKARQLAAFIASPAGATIWQKWGYRPAEK